FLLMEPIPHLPIPFPLLELSLELIDYVFSFADNKTLLLLRKVCTTTKSVVDGLASIGSVIEEIIMKEEENSVCTVTLCLLKRQSRLFLLRLMNTKHIYEWGISERILFNLTFDEIPGFLLLLKPLISNTQINYARIDWSGRDYVLTDLLTNFYSGLQVENLKLRPQFAMDMKWNRLEKLVRTFRPECILFFFVVSDFNKSLAIIGKMAETPAVSVIDVGRSDEPTPGIGPVVMEVLRNRCWFLSMGYGPTLTLADVNFLIRVSLNSFKMSPSAQSGKSPTFLETLSPAERACRLERAGE
ncbi:hypothetical protein PFISCL1PPCAC_3970, partial [Pristionchus fissidentatus]